MESNVNRVDHKSQARGRWLAALLVAAGSGAQAAGGHHAVDDAAILESGTCEIEAWMSGSRGAGRAFHAGAGCRVGPIELAVAGEYARQGGASATGDEVQAKWATEIAPKFHLGVSITPQFAARARPRHQGTVVVGLLTWAARDDVAVHVNAGRALLRDAPDQGRWGTAVEWTVREGWSLVGERYYEDRTHFARMGLRHTLSKEWSVDFSRAQRLRGAGESTWTVGVTRAL